MSWSIASSGQHWLSAWQGAPIVHFSCNANHGNEKHISERHYSYH